MRTTDPVLTIDQHSLPGHSCRKMRARRLYRGRQPQPDGSQLSGSEIERLMKAARYAGRFGLRDATLILVAYRHGFRVSELINLKWSHIDFAQGTIVVSRLKSGLETVHPLSDQEKESLRQLQCSSGGDSDLVFVSGRNGPLTLPSIHKMLRRAGEGAGLRHPIRPSMLHTARGFDLVSASSQLHSVHH